MHKLKTTTKICILALLLQSCAAYSRDNIGFWDQKVAFTAWGFTMATEFGPFNVGYIQWGRNVAPQTAASPTDIINRATQP